MGFSLIDIIKQASAIPLGELHARATGDTQSVAESVALLLSEGFIQISSDGPDDLSAGTPELSSRLKRILDDGPAANSFVATPTAKAFRI